MIGLAAVALATGFLGSVHCVFMCGGLAGAATSGGGGATRRIVLYQVGRGAAYALLGVLAGLAGTAIDLTGAAIGLSRVALVLAALVLIGSGLWTLMEAAGVSMRSSSAGLGLSQRVTGWIGRRLGRVPHGARPLILGAATGLLPCGFLWTTLALAAGTGSPWTGAAVMVAFAIGTMPATSGVGAVLAGVLARSGRTTRAVAGMAIVCVGLWAVWNRGRFDPPTWARGAAAAEPAAAGEPHPEVSCCHHPEGEP